MSRISGLAVAAGMQVLLLLALLPVAPSIGAEIYQTTATPVWETNAGAVVRSILPNAAGSSIYVGGTFASLTSPDGATTVAQPWLAALDAAGAANTSFAPTLDGLVHDLELSADESTLYVAGEFTSVNGQSVQGIVALDSVTGATKPGFGLVVNGDVLDLSLDGSDLYLAGKFTVANAASRVRLAKVDASTGVVDAAWNPEAVAGGAGAWAIAAEPTTGRVYVGGYFTSIDNVVGTGNLAAVSITTGEVDMAFRPNPGAEAYDVVATSDRVYAALGGPGGRLTIYNPNDGSLRADWFGDGDVQALSLSDDSVYVAGHQELFGTATVPWIARVDHHTDQIDPTFDPSISAAVGQGLWAVHASSADLWLGGSISAASPVDGVGLLRYAVIPGGPPPPPTPPTTPTSLTAPVVADSSVHLTWGASTDDSGLVGYRIYRDGVEVGSSVTASWTDNTAVAETTYQYYVRAVDPDGTLSPVSNTITVTTTTALAYTNMIPFGSVWKYDDGGAAHPTGWTTSTFNDDGWAQGPAMLGANEPSAATVIAQTHTVRMRHSFPVLADQFVAEATLRFQRDDGVQIFVNGTEVHRDNMPAGTIDATTDALTPIYGLSEQAIMTVSIDPSLFTPGENTIAVGVHNSAGSIDMRFDAELTLRVGVTNWDLVFNDEFATNSLDSSKWTPESSGFGSESGTLHCMRPANVSVANDALVLQARVENDFCDGQSKAYTSGMVSTQGQGEWLYGRFEVRAKIPEGQGLWSAAWTGSVAKPYGDWPASGELDIVETLGQDPDKSVHTAHWGPGPTSIRSSHAETHPVSLADGFHVYRMEWTPGQIEWFVDDALVHTSTPADGWSVPGGGAGPNAPFDEPIFLRLSLFVGGNWPGPPDGSTPFPGDFVVDYVRVYQEGVYCNGLPVTVDIGAGDSPTSGDDVILGTSGDDVINAMAGNDTVCAGDGDDTVYAQTGDDTVLGEGGDDVLLGFGGADDLRGGAGADVINGGIDSDVLSGGAGADVIYGQGGNDVISGGAGPDLLIGVDGDDNLEGGPGDDVLNGGPGADTVDGGEDDDTVYGGPGSDVLLTGGAGADLVYGQTGNDVLDGGDGDDSVWGNEDDDVLTDPSGTNVLNGGPGDDQITGGSGSDSIYGDGSLTHAGNDVLDGGAGTDLLVGFAGDDTLVSDDGEPDTVNGGPHTTGDSCTTDASDTVYNCP